ncbi:MAG: phosphoglycolate phosphatase [Burkholderiales bacterium]
MTNNIFPLQVKAVAIDLDGTLLDTISDLAHAANLMRLELGMNELAEELIKTFVGKGLVNLVRRTLAGGGDSAHIGEAELQHAVAIYERHYASVLTRATSHYPGVLDGLRTMHDAGFRLACITNKAEKFTLPLLKQMNLAHFFDITVSGDTTAKRKPDPMPLLHAAEYFHISPGEMLLIGDSANDYEAARAAGCPVFLVPYGYNEGRDATQLPAEAIISGLDEAAKLIQNSTAKHKNYSI